MSRDDEYSPGVAFALWLACIFGVCGIHRFYLGKPITGLIYVFTFGLLGVGQLVDLIRLRGMVDEQNQLAAGERHFMLPPPQMRLGSLGETPQPSSRAINTEEDLRRALLGAAAKRGGSLSVTQGVLASGKSFEEVEAALDAMVHKGYADIGNDPKSGVVVYQFGDLA